MFLIKYDDFRRFAENNNKRIYYYKRDNIVDLFFLVDGTMVRSYVDITSVENVEFFFQDRVFMGAIELLFPIPFPEGSKTVDDVLVGNPFLSQFSPVEREQPDIQREGVE